MNLIGTKKQKRANAGLPLQVSDVVYAKEKCYKKLIQFLFLNEKTITY